MNEDELNQKLALQKTAIEFLTTVLAEGKKESSTIYPLNRGDIMALVMIIEQELRVASLDWRNPLNQKRLKAIREKLGVMAIDAPQMSTAEAQQFRE